MKSRPTKPVKMPSSVPMAAPATAAGLAPAYGFVLVMLGWAVVLNGIGIWKLRAWNPSGEPIMQRETAKWQRVVTEAGIKAIEEQGRYLKDADGDYETPTVNGRECAYAIYDERGILKCAIEQAYNDGKIDFKKPISCHLYPIRVTKYEHYHALNYDRWHICKPACSHGESLKVPLYKFLKAPLTRAYGEEWYAQLVNQIEAKEVVE